MIETTQSARNIVFVVHGSNAHSWWRRMANGGYPWWRRWSLFCCELRDAFDEGCSIREFRWSGRNEHQARLDAGTKLSQAVEEARAREPARKIHIVGHSHGGNVALVAANRAKHGTIETLVLLANPCMAVAEKPGDPLLPLYWGDAPERVGRIWNLYAPDDPVQVGLATRFHGLPNTLAKSLRVSRAPEVSSPRLINTAVQWQGAAASHRAMHSSVMGRVVGRLLRGDEFAAAMSAAGLSTQHPNPASDRGGWPGVDKTQALIRRRGNGRPFDIGDLSTGVGILLVHGFTASPAEMRPLAEALVRRSNWRCKGLLLPGHGGALEDMQQARGEDWIVAVEQAVSELERECRHVFLCGLSLGAVLVCHAALRRQSASQLRGLLLLAPAFGVTLKREIGMKLLRRVTNFRNKGVRAADYFLDHRLNSHLYTPLNLASEVLRLGNEATARLGELHDLPSVLFAGNLESTVSLEKIRAAARANPRIRFIGLPKSRHILPVEPDRETLFETSAQFVEECLRKYDQ